MSYSWKPVSNRQRALMLAERLTLDGVNVIIDEWNLSEGQNKYQFMEQMVNNEEIKRVLLICNKDYKEKANLKKGGVGIESLIVSNEIYTQAEQKKFIPIIFERDERGEAYLPTFIDSRIYIDLSSDEIFENEYEKLIRNIFDKPASKRPPLGTPPAYLIEEQPIFLRTAHKVKTIRDALLNEKRNSQFFVEDYYATFISALADFSITESNDPNVNVDDIVLNKIEEMKTLRDDFVNFLETTLDFPHLFEMENFISFFEKLVELIVEETKKKFTYNSGFYRADQYRFFFYELMIYVSAVMCERGKFKELSIFLENDFVIFDENYRDSRVFTYTIFNQRAETLDELRNKRLKLNRRSVTADLIKQRADNNRYSFTKLRECDILLYYIGILKDQGDLWFPITAAYDTYNLGILNKLISKRFFEKIKVLFYVDTVDELKSKITDIAQTKKDRVERYYFSFPYIYKAFNFENIATSK